MKHVVAMALLAAGAAQAGMIGDPVTASILINGNKVGSWDGVSSNVVGPGIEFALVDNFLGFDAVLTLDIGASTFTLKEATSNLGGPFDIAFDSIQFTDLNQTFTGVSLEAGNTWPGGTFTGSSVTANSITIFMDEPVIVGGDNWTATWDVSFASATAPEPGSIPLFAIGIGALIAWRKRQ